MINPWHHMPGMIPESRIKLKRSQMKWMSEQGKFFKNSFLIQSRPHALLLFSLWIFAVISSEINIAFRCSFIPSEWFVIFSVTRSGLSPASGPSCNSGASFNFLKCSKKTSGNDSLMPSFLPPYFYLTTSNILWHYLNASIWFSCWAQCNICVLEAS